MKKKKAIPTKYLKAIQESREYMKKRKETQKDLNLIIKANIK